MKLLRIFNIPSPSYDYKMEKHLVEESWSRRPKIKKKGASIHEKRNKENNTN